MELKRFECFIDDNEKITVTIKYSPKIEIIGISYQDDALIQLEDLPEKTQGYILEKTKEYIDKINNEK